MHTRSRFLGLATFLCAAFFTVLASAASFTGTWDTEWSDGTAVGMKLKQNDGRVFGTYAPNGGRIAGSVDGNIATGGWSEANGSRGEFYFELSRDGRRFKGFWKYQGRRNWQGGWKGWKR